MIIYMLCINNNMFEPFLFYYILFISTERAAKQ